MSSSRLVNRLEMHKVLFVLIWDSGSVFFFHFLFLFFLSINAAKGANEGMFAVYCFIALFRHFFGMGVGSGYCGY